jgi:hypothetical protein
MWRLSNINATAPLPIHHMLPGGNIAAEWYGVTLRSRCAMPFSRFGQAVLTALQSLTKSPSSWVYRVINRTRQAVERSREDANCEVLAGNEQRLSEAAKQWHVPLALKGQAVPTRPTSCPVPRSQTGHSASVFGLAQVRTRLRIYATLLL